MDDQHVTQRRIKTNLNESWNTSLISTTSSDYHAQSLPDLSTGNLHDHEFVTLKEEFEKMKLKLMSANIEIDNLNTEIRELKTITENQEKTILQLKTICSSPISSSKRNQTLRKKRLSCLHDSKMNSSTSDLGLQSDEENKIRGTILTRCMASQTDVATINSHPWAHVNEHTLGISVPQRDVAVNNILPVAAPQKQSSEMLILGGKQCTGLASHIIQSRQDSKFMKYRISSIIKPHATTEEILNPSYKFKDTIKNCLIICIGENDTNPIKIEIELSALLKRMKNTQIIILNVLKSNYLNEYKLNSTLKTICKNFTNCSFIDINLYNCYLNKYQYFTYACKKINYILDSLYYDRTYLNFKSTAITAKPKSNEESPKRGTIPFYFPVIDKEQITANNINQPSFFRLSNVLNYGNT